MQYTLRSPASFFLSALTYVCFFPANGAFLAETGARFATDHLTILSNGAYILRAHVPQNRRELVKNTRYWDRDNVHIDRLFFQFNREAAALAPEMFVRGEISSASIPTAIIDGWRLDPVRRELLRPAPVGAFAFWHAFNFNPRMAPQFEPENWRRAVLNLNFRKAIFHGLDRVAAMLTFDPYDPLRQISNTITPVNFASVDGIDYTNLPALQPIVRMQVFDRALALTHRNRAMTELRAAGVTFPIRVKMPFNTGSPDWTNRAQVIEQQLESLFGREFIDVMPVGYPPTGFLDATRRPGNYAIQEVNWGPDFLDPEAYTQPFEAGHLTYSDIALASANYQRLLNAAKAEGRNIRRRFELFAEAEAYLIQNALVMPYRVGGGGYVASRLHPFQGSYAAAGPAVGKFKFQRLLDRAMNVEQFNEAQTIWARDRVIALRKAGQ
ncbi:MAG: Oligopeptide-binding protein SarA [Firmicutes bacterium]|nr:Oligopeptide-binding protein SarA [Bacillota bacterium]